jgi:hypothetical protein
MWSEIEEKEPQRAGGHHRACHTGTMRSQKERGEG